MDTVFAFNAIVILPFDLLTLKQNFKSNHLMTFECCGWEEARVIAPDRQHQPTDRPKVWFHSSTKNFVLRVNSYVRVFSYSLFIDLHMYSTKVWLDKHKLFRIEWSYKTKPLYMNMLYIYCRWSYRRYGNVCCFKSSEMKANNNVTRNNLFQDNCSYKNIKQNTLLSNTNIEMRSFF